MSNRYNVGQALPVETPYGNRPGVVRSFREIPDIGCVDYRYEVVYRAENGLKVVTFLGETAVARALGQTILEGAK